MGSLFSSWRPGAGEEGERENTDNDAAQEESNDAEESGRERKTGFIDGNGGFVEARVVEYVEADQKKRETTPNPNLPPWKPGWVGIEYFPTVRRNEDVVLITCRNPVCDRPLRIEFRSRDPREEAWLAVEPMFWQNPCWWFCQSCASGKYNVPFQNKKKGEPIPGLVKVEAPSSLPCLAPLAAFNKK